MKNNKTNKKFYHIRYDKILVKIDFGLWSGSSRNTNLKTETKTENGISLRTRCLFSKCGRKLQLCR